MCTPYFLLTKEPLLSLRSPTPIIRKYIRRKFSPRQLSRGLLPQLLHLFLFHCLIPERFLTPISFSLKKTPTASNFEILQYKCIKSKGKRKIFQKMLSLIPGSSTCRNSEGERRKGTTKGSWDRGTEEKSNRGT